MFAATESLATDPGSVTAYFEGSQELLHAIADVLDIRSVFPRVSEIAKRMLPHDALTMASQDEDLSIQLQLGIRLARAGKHQEAIGSFQQARNSPEHRVEALHQAGLSFEAVGNPKLAERSYQEALKGVKSDDTNTLNALHYRLGRVAEAQGNYKDAEEHYNEVAANDYSYLDVAERLKNIALNS